MAAAVRDERQVAGRQGMRLAVDLEQAAALGHHVEAHAPVERRHLDAPGRAAFGSAVEGPPHPQIAEDTSDRVDGRPRLDRVGGHAVTLVRHRPAVQRPWTNGHGFRIQGRSAGPFVRATLDAPPERPARRERSGSCECW
jgi:hypothetical protein